MLDRIIKTVEIYCIMQDIQKTLSNDQEACARADERLVALSLLEGFVGETHVAQYKQAAKAMHETREVRAALYQAYISLFNAIWQDFTNKKTQLESRAAAEVDTIIQALKTLFEECWTAGEQAIAARSLAHPLSLRDNVVSKESIRPQVIMQRLQEIERDASRRWIVVEAMSLDVDKHAHYIKGTIVPLAGMFKQKKSMADEATVLASRTDVVECERLVRKIFDERSRAQQEISNFMRSDLLQSAGVAMYHTVSAFDRLNNIYTDILGHTVGGIFDVLDREYAGIAAVDPKRAKAQIKEKIKPAVDRALRAAKAVKPTLSLSTEQVFQELDRHLFSPVGGEFLGKLSVDIRDEASALALKHAMLALVQEPWLFHGLCVAFMQQSHTLRVAHASLSVNAPPLQCPPSPVLVAYSAAQQRAAFLEIYQQPLMIQKKLAHYHGVEHKYQQLKNMTATPSHVSQALDHVQASVFQVLTLYKMLDALYVQILEDVKPPGKDSYVYICNTKNGLTLAVHLDASYSELKVYAPPACLDGLFRSHAAFCKTLQTLQKIAFVQEEGVARAELLVAREQEEAASRMARGSCGFFFGRANRSHVNVSAAAAQPYAAGP